MNFMAALKNQANSGDLNVSVTENGALGYRTTQHALLDMNFAISSLRGKPEAEIEAMFAAACAENLDLAIVWMVFARDIRGGVGERRLFRVCFRYLAREFPEKAVKIVPLIAEYGRWDDVVDLMFTISDEPIKKALFEAISTQLNADLVAMRDKKSVSLAAKWLPSESTSSQETRNRARKLAMLLGVTPRSYRKKITALRRYLDVVERKMSAKQWSEIDYEKVPSKANLLYRKAFARNDPDRREAFLLSLKEDPKKIKASVLFPHEIVEAYDLYAWKASSAKVDPTLEALWNNLPNVFPGDAPKVLVVADGSGSMLSRENGVCLLSVANALALYFAERLPEPYKDQYITFSDRPQYVNLRGATTLLGKLQIAMRHDEIASTDIERVFNLILNTAIQNHLKQEELPETVLVLSDMEFNWAVRRADERLFDVIACKYADAGYKLPRLAFWNLGSRTGTIPITENELGVSLISGFSTTLIKMVMTGSLDAYGAMVEVLKGERYKPVWEALK